MTLPLFEISEPSPPPDAEQPTPAAADPTPAPVQYVAWLASLVHTHQYGKLADLRRPATADNPTHFEARAFAPTEEHRALYRQVGFLFARYHAGRTKPHYGRGSMGTAIRAIGYDGARGPSNPGAERLMMRILPARQIPWRHLQHAIERIRAGETTPPSWADLITDLTQWTDRGRPTPQEWGDDFYTRRRSTHARPNGAAK
ncbi:type I-E CRISPR-associated protein Cse2/CasB [Streptomyces sp. NPDC015171]|uniref:type I-E CRISPR-associated protein Cse2/CasB n=1 Tax=Streptomyces sp. NPDC015171 TaxID=3364945 RepID=UPI0036FE2077